LPNDPWGIIIKIKRKRWRQKEVQKGSERKKIKTRKMNI
jgi:hypothetical protein